MTITNNPSDVFSDMELKLMETLNERQLRQFVAAKADEYGCHGVSIVCGAYDINRDTVYRGIKELRSSDNDTFPSGRVRAKGGGPKCLLDKHPEYLVIFDEIADGHTAGLPQDDTVRWLTISTTTICKLFEKRGIKISPYHVRQMKQKRGFRDRSFTKALTLKDVKDRNAQFEKIKQLIEWCLAHDIPLFSMDVKKKEMIGNFKRAGKVSCIGQPKALDHDFLTFANGTIVPHGIYDMLMNIGYLTLGTSHDTAEFSCDCFAAIWRNHLQWNYPNANTIALLCDGGGSNSSSHHIVKQELMKLARTLGLNIIMIHYPPYCSKYNPIEHRMFGPLTRSWSGAPLMSVEDARQRAEMTQTKKGLSIIATVNQRTYETKRPIEESYESNRDRLIVFDKKLPKWNYIIKCASA